MNNKPSIKEVDIPIHPFAKFIDGYTDTVEAPEMVVDDVWAAGTVCIAGERGLGKTSMLVPLALVPAGVLLDYPLQAKIRRKVVYVAEDVAQVRRIISAMRSTGLITASKQEFNQWFRLVEAKRLPPREIVKVVPDYEDLWTPNTKSDGSIYLAPPLVILDTTNATINLDNISDNAEVSSAVSLLRQEMGRINLVLVGHVAKASRNDVKQVTFIGAGSWEGDTQQTMYLVSDNNERYLVLGKKRFETEVTEYIIRSHEKEFEATDKLGYTVLIRCFYGIPEATTGTKKQEAKERADTDRKAAGWTACQNRILEYVGENPGASTRNISATVSGASDTVRDALQELVETGQIEQSAGLNGGQAHDLSEIGTVRHSPH